MACVAALPKGKHGIGDRLKNRRISKGMTRRELAEKIGVSEDSIRNYELEAVKLWRNEDHVAALAAALETTEKQLLEGELNQPSLLDIRKRRKIYITGPVAAGPPITPSGDVEDFWIDDWGTLRLRWGHPVQGDSMEPILHDGDLCIFEEGDPEVGNIVVAYAEGKGTTIRTMRRDEKGEKILRPENPVASLTPSEYTVKGYCVEIYRDLGGALEQVVRNKFGGAINADRLRRGS